MAGIYIHIPFCKQACNYCNFYFTTSLGNKDRFIKALLTEIDLSSNYLETKKLETIYFGGGTPSQLSVNEIAAIIKELELHYDLSGLKEFTFETNPDDLTAEKVKQFKDLKLLGLNRFSIGIQSFFDDDLVYMNRAHNSSEALTAIKKVQDAGFDNITIDLIYGTPTMNNEHWQQNLETAFSLGVPHISAYALTVEPKTTLRNKIKKGERQPVSDEQSSGQFAILMQQMKSAGFEQYEISNFAKPGHYAIHNSNYWRGKKYLGLGPSAHSYNIVSRKWNIANNINYIESIARGIIPAETETLTAAQIINEKIMTSLRTMWGLNLHEISPIAAASIKNDLQTINPAHYIIKDKTLLLTDAGKMYADGIAAALFVADEQFL